MLLSHSSYSRHILCVLSRKTVHNTVKRTNLFKDYSAMTLVKLGFVGLLKTLGPVAWLTMHGAPLNPSVLGPGFGLPKWHLRPTIYSTRIER